MELLKVEKQSLRKWWLLYLMTASGMMVDDLDMVQATPCMYRGNIS